MGRLAHRDFKALLGFLRGIYASLDPDILAVQATRSLLDVVPADRCSYNEWGSDRMIRCFVEPDGSFLRGRLSEALSRYGYESPILTYYRRTSRTDVCTFSDFVTRSELRRLALYNEYYRQVGVEYQIIAPLTLTSASTTREIGFALSRQRVDFSARDRLVLELLQPHLIQAYANALAVARAHASGADLADALDTNKQGTIVLGRRDEIRFASRRGRQYLREYFGGSGRGARLPEDLARWVKHEEQALTGDSGVPAPRCPLVVTRERTRLSARLLSDGKQRVLLLEERYVALDPATLAPLGLSPRQSEVLVWLAEGKRNEEIGLVLGASPSTIAKHLERIYRKLGVETRTAAVARALAVGGMSP